MTLLLYVLLTGSVFAAAPTYFDEKQHVAVMVLRKGDHNVTCEEWDVRTHKDLWDAFLKAPFHNNDPCTAGFVKDAGVSRALQQFSVSSRIIQNDDNYLTPPDGWLWWSGPLNKVACRPLDPGRVRICLWGSEIAIEGVPA